MINIKRKKTFIVSMAVIGCLIFNSNLKLAAITIDGSTRIGSFFSTIVSIIGDELAFSAVTTSNLLTDALSSRMTSVKGCLADPFVHAIYSHSQNNIASGCSYKDDAYGLILGADHVWAFANEKYFRLGTALGYMNETPISFEDFSGIVRAFNAPHNIDPGKFNIGSKQDIYAVRLFGAYESFDDKCLKTNFGVIFGYNYGKDRFAVFKSHSLSLRVESIKNLYAYNGYQFGLWLQSDYSYILQYADSSKTPSIIDFGFGFAHSFLATVVGLNIEKEVFKHVDKKLTLSLKTGWECRVMQHTDADFDFAFPFVDVDGLFKLKYPRRNAAIVSFRALQKLNNHWNIVGSYSARFNKNISIHDLSC
ncbi:MAG: autotransporter outer membrane beta-barrel domain-containing protein, partial [Puniceicoccales bacterium]|nr:autotransporter outer membrane beta-barrel domain-containing protein [Puniceicoccales bacterium]